jgi:GLPGLI family protein
MKKNILLLIVLTIPCFNCPLLAQKTIKVNYLYQDDTGFQCTSQLYIRNSESSFRIKDTRPNGIYQPKADSIVEGDGATAVEQPYYVDNDSISTFFFTNSQRTFARFPYDDGKELFYQHANSGSWQFLPDVKQIQKYACKKAKIVKNGRTFSAWYSLDIPISQGPMRLHGLPGLIMELEEEGKYCTIHFQSIEMDTKDVTHESIKNYVQSKKPQSYTDYEKFMMKRIVAKKVLMVNEIAKMKTQNGLDSSAEMNFIVPYSDFYGAILDLPTGINVALDKIKF